MRIAIGCDRRGFHTKERLLCFLKELNHEVEDVGTYDSIHPVDYPIYAEKVGKLVSSGYCDYGVVICSTGIGIMIAANKVKGIRCGIAYSDDVARLMREHNDANVICFGQDYMSYDDIERRLVIFLRTNFSGGYHCSRIEQIRNLENGIEIEQTPMEREFR